MNIQRLLLKAALATCLLSACTTEDLPGGSEQPVAPGEVGTFTFNLATGSPLSVDTRSISDYSALNDIWVVQLNAAGTAALVPPQRVTSITSDKKIRVKLKVEESKVYFFANTEKTDLFNTSAALTTFTAASVEATTINNNNATVWESDRTYMPMFGTWPASGTGTPTVPTISGTTELTRVLSRVTVNVTNDTGGKLAISSMQLKNIPGVAQLCPSTAATYPATTVRYYNSSPHTSASVIYTVAENCRGTGSGRYETEKTAAMVTNGAYATHYEIKGKYNGKIDVTYRFYLGENTTNNYNIKRNTQYTFNISIKGMNQTDMRVTVETQSFSPSSNTGITWGDGSSENVDGSI